MPSTWLGPDLPGLLKLAVAIATSVLLLAGLLLRRAGRPDACRRGRDAALLVLGVVGGLGWWSFFSLPSWLHSHDAYHYFIGARYFAELGYTRLYSCTVIADIEAGLGHDLEGRRVRNLETNMVERGSKTAADPERCKEHFSPERWLLFTADVAWFRSRLPELEWRRLQMDHGFNGSPVWLLTAARLASAEGGAERWLLPLSLLDPLLLAAMWAFVGHAFGWRAACVAAVFWGTNGFADSVWTGGSFLRQDWLVALVLAIACLRQRLPGAAGALATFSMLLRIFPGFAVAALAIERGLAALRTRSLRLSRETTRFAVGGLLALGLLLPLARWSEGPAAWTGFVANSRKHLGTPLLNQMGLRTVVAYDSASRASALENLQAADPYLSWKLAQHRHFEQRWWIYGGLAAIYAALLLRAIRGQDAWVVLALGTGAIPIATQLTCYYHAALIGLALLWVRREAAGVALCLLAAASQAILRAFSVSDEAFVWMSLAEVLAIFLVTALFAAQRPAREIPAPGSG